MPQCPQPLLRSAFLLAAAAGLSGCFAETTVSVLGAGGLYYATHPEEVPIEDWSNVPGRREPRVTRMQFRHEVEFGFGLPGMTEDEGARLNAFVARTRLGFGDRVVVLAGVPELDDEAEARRLADRRRETVAAFLTLNGVEARLPDGDFGSEVPAGDAVAVLVDRYVASLPACPDWTGKPGYNFNNQVSSNFGCATAVNLGMMVADPGDLVRGREMGPADGERTARAIERYRKGETKALTPEDVAVTQAAQKSKSDSGAEN